MSGFEVVLNVIRSIWINISPWMNVGPKVVLNVIPIATRKFCYNIICNFDEYLDQKLYCYEIVTRKC